MAGAYGAEGNRPSFFGLPLVPNAREMETPDLMVQVTCGSTREVWD